MKKTVVHFIIFTILSINIANANNANNAANDSFNGLTLTIPLVQAAGNLYSNVVITVDKVLQINGGESFYAYDTYDSTSNQLTIRDVDVGSAHFTNVVISVGKVLSVGASMPDGIATFALERNCYKVDCVDALDKFKLLSTINPSSDPMALTSTTNLSSQQKVVISKAESIFNANPTLAFILIDKDQIVYEKYHPLINANTPLMGYSMSKSLTSLTIGNALCNGQLKNMDTKLADVNNKMADLIYGQSTIKQLLMMSSGGPRGTVSNGGVPANAGFGNLAYNPLTYWYTYNQLQKYNYFQIKEDGNYARPGEEFSYKDLDNLALSFLFPVSGPNSFSSIFQEQVWKKYKTQDKGYWVYDKDGVINTQGSFQATPRDWARVAIGIKNSLIANNTNDCLTTYLKTATTTQIKNTGSTFKNPDEWIGQAFNGYGYQFWTDNTSDTSDTFYMSGYRGQRIAINPKKNKIMIVFSYVENYMGLLYSLFGSWN